MTDVEKLLKKKKNNTLVNDIRRRDNTEKTKLFK